ncbi:hypothetical protein BurJ1DRAFT_0958 [Burkholderiales bacterium JOSHI_001]|nr:hypothetical protein BurJ1DRAFT_0958 [Burkholderiales bacterium JOSHI_001]
MDLLHTAVVDITTLLATCRACRSVAADVEPVLQRRLRQHLRAEIKRATLAYIDTLARSRRGAVDDALLGRCRLAAERQMADALAQQPLLSRIMASEAGALDGLAAARQDLWRLANVATHLASGMAAWRAGHAGADLRRAETPAARLRRRLRKALIAYARAALRSRPGPGRLIAKARLAALADIGTRGWAAAETLAELEASATGATAALRQGVAKPLRDLRLDWQGVGHPPQ